MDEQCCCPPAAGSLICEVNLSQRDHQLPLTPRCPTCGTKGKSVERHTVRALLGVSLRRLQLGDYLFCRGEECPIVYFSSQGRATFTTNDVREQVYQKEPEAADVFVCYCFRHTVRALRQASSHEQMTIVADINAGIQAGQCACDIRNPQGSCCLGNVRGLIKQLQQAAEAFA